ncbi:uncharacterized protein [Anabrus simplex]|uniref:uncharacterized protein isoform X2 n=1 Tax=Anabrus simplex TaxID=316456 RepID=UPI0035A3894D
MPSRSQVWDYFTRSTGHMVTCNICSVILSVKGSTTSNMTRHLRLKHPGINIRDSRLRVINSDTLGENTGFVIVPLQPRQAPPQPPPPPINYYAETPSPTSLSSKETTMTRKEREAAIKAGLIPPDDASSSESSPDPQPGTSQDPPLETSLKDKPATYSKAASRAVKEQLSEHEEPGSWNTNEVFIKQEVDLSDGIIEDDNSIGNSSVGESEFSQIRQPDLNKQAGNRRGSTELSQERLPKKRKAALEHAYIRPHLPVTARQVQEEKSSVVESQPEQVWDPISTESAEQSKRKSQETPYGTQKESIAHQKEELEAVLLRLQVKKLLLEMEKISEERERIAVEKSNITLRYKCLELREKLNNSILSGTATERLGCASSFIPTIIVDSSSVARSKCSISAVSPGSKSSAAGKKCYASSPVKSRKSSSLSGKGNISTPATSNKSSESGICKISAKDVSSSKAMVQHTSDPETIQDTTPPKCISSVAGGHVMKGKVSGQDKLPLKQTQQKQTTSKAHIEISNTTHTKSKVQSVPSSINSSSEVCLASVPSDTLYPVSPSVESHSVSLPPQISETAKTTSSSSVNKLLVSPTQQPNQESCVKDEPVMTKLDNGEKITVSSSPSQTSHMVKGPTTCSGDGRNTSSAKKYLVPSSEQPDLKVSVKEPVDAKLDIAEEMSEPSHSQCVPVSTFKEDGELLSDDNDQLAKRRKLS